MSDPKDPPRRFQRLQSATIREQQSIQARDKRERERAERNDYTVIGAPQFVSPDDEVTGNFEGEELDRRRSMRPPEDRLHRLEKYRDELAASQAAQQKAHLQLVDSHIELASHVSDLREVVGKVDGKLDILTDLHKQAAEQQTVKFTAEVEVDKHAKFAVINDEASQKELARQEAAKQKQFKRALVLKILAIFGSGGGIGALIALLASKC